VALDAAAGAGKIWRISVAAGKILSHLWRNAKAFRGSWIARASALRLHELRIALQKVVDKEH
jgi:hypothetical protein